MTPDDSLWRRPPDSEPPAAAAPAEAPRRSGYLGPPPTNPPAPGWRPEFVVEPPAPRALPAQDHAAVDAAERSARTVTYGVGIVAGAVLLIVLCALCGRALL
jgi:hypothetical protein